jgi:hypothetical protein
MEFSAGHLSTGGGCASRKVGLWATLVPVDAHFFAPTSSSMTILWSAKNAQENFDVMTKEFSSLSENDNDKNSYSKSSRAGS